MEKLSCGVDSCDERDTISWPLRKEKPHCCRNENVLSIHIESYNRKKGLPFTKV